MTIERTRKEFLIATAAGAARIVLSGNFGCEPFKRVRATASPEWPHPVRAFRSRPDLRPPDIEGPTPAHDTAPGYVFIAPKTGPGYERAVQNGPMIVDNTGRKVWLRPMRGEGVRAMDFKVQSYRGEPVLTWYEGVGLTYGRGEYVIADGSYREVTRVRAGNG